jgi:RNA polymerase-binding transcription factor DksA
MRERDLKHFQILPHEKPTSSEGRIAPSTADRQGRELPDPTDQPARVQSQLTLRIRDRERKLIVKIRKPARIDDGSYGK